MCVPLRCVPCSWNGNTCVMIPLTLNRLFHGKADIVDLVLRHYHGASGWDAARFDAGIRCEGHSDGVTYLQFKPMDTG